MWYCDNVTLDKKKKQYKKLHLSTTFTHRPYALLPSKQHSNYLQSLHLFLPTPPNHVNDRRTHNCQPWKVQQKRKRDRRRAHRQNKLSRHISDGGNRLLDRTNLLNLIPWHHFLVNLRNENIKHPHKAPRNYHEASEVPQLGLFRKQGCWKLLKKVNYISKPGLHPQPMCHQRYNLLYTWVIG